MQGEHLAQSESKSIHATLTFYSKTWIVLFLHLKTSFLWWKCVFQMLQYWASAIQHWATVPQMPWYCYWARQGIPQITCSLSLASAASYTGNLFKMIHPYGKMIQLSIALAGFNLVGLSNWQKVGLGNLTWLNLKKTVNKSFWNWDNFDGLCYSELSSSQ